MNSYFSPLIEWKMDVLREFGRELGYIYTHEATDKPVVATASKDQVKEGEIYFRYNGQSTVIKYAELRGMIDDRLARERQAWLQHLRTIAHTGPTNVAMLDTVQGKLYGGGTPFIIDEPLLRKLKFLRQGRFSETEGQPTLRLVGDVQPVSGVPVERPVEVGIHEADIIEAFLAQCALEPSQAKAYLHETAYQATPYLPLWYLLSRAEMSVDKAVQFLRRAGSPRGDQVSKLVSRLEGGDTIKALGAVGDVGSNEKPLVAEALEKELSAAKTQKDKRTLLLAALKVDPAAIADLSVPAPRLLEAVTHLEPSVVGARKGKLLELLLAIYTRQFSSMTSPERSVFRKAVAFCDQALNSNDAFN